MKNAMKQNRTQNRRQKQKAKENDQRKTFNFISYLYKFFFSAARARKRLVFIEFCFSFSKSFPAENEMFHFDRKHEEMTEAKTLTQNSRRLFFKLKTSIAQSQSRQEKVCKYRTTRCGKLLHLVSV